MVSPVAYVAQLGHEVPVEVIDTFDLDLYESMIDGLRYFGPRLLPGGVIVLDDYGSPHLGGVRRAAEEYLAEGYGFQSWHPHTKQLVLLRRG